ncbi:hypothetical protein CN09_28605 [Rhizobium rhizogenes]|nr:hypothetical protein CN09_28605 [Rhizobium rhizogenes]
MSTGDAAAMLMTMLIIGLVLGETLALIALGLTIQYGAARIVNLAFDRSTLTLRCPLVAFCNSDKSASTNVGLTLSYAMHRFFL